MGRLVVKRHHDVEHALDLFRVTAGSAGRLVDCGVSLRRVLGAQVVAAETRQPAVGQPAREPQHSRHVSAKPDSDRVGGLRTMVRPHDLVVLPSNKTDRSTDQGSPDHQRLFERADGLLGRAPRSARRLDRVPERDGAHPQLDPAWLRTSGDASVLRSGWAAARGG